MKRLKTYVVIGGLWFDKVNGNTYCVAKIIDIETERKYYTDYQYGYSTHYIHVAHDYIKDELHEDRFKILVGGSFYMKKRELKEKQW